MIRKLCERVCPTKNVTKKQLGISEIFFSMGPLWDPQKASCYGAVCDLHLKDQVGSCHFDDDPMANVVEVHKFPATVVNQEGRLYPK